MAERLQKFLAKSGIGSRRYCEELIKSKKIKVNGQIALIGSSVNKNDEVEYDGNIISFTESEIRSVSFRHLTVPTMRVGYI